MHDIYALKEMLCRELEEYGRKGEMSAGTLDIVDKLAHAVKNLGKIIEMSEDEGYSEARGGNSYRQGQGGRGNSNRGRGRSYAYDGQRGGNSNRYSMNDGYSYAEDDANALAMELRGIAEDLPDHKKREVMKFIQKMEQM